MTNSSTVRLLEVEPDFGRFLTAEERTAALAELIVPTLSIEQREADVLARVESTGAFGAIVLEGVLAEELQLGGQLAVRLLGPGDGVWLSGRLVPAVLSSVRFTAAAPSRLALLGKELLVGTRRWPRLVLGLYLRAGQQNDRLAAQLAICQLSRVEDRILALMWLLAECWGRVTPAGTRLPLSLTHDMLGALIGARRPTVTLALRELAERGAIVHQDQGWLLLEAPPEPAIQTDRLGSSILVEDASSSWSASSEQDARDARHDRAQVEASYRAVRDAVAGLQERHVQMADGFNEQLGRMVSSRKRSADSRRRVARDRLRRRRSPSS